MQTNSTALFAVKQGSLACVRLIAQYGRRVSRLLYFAAVPTLSNFLSVSAIAPPFKGMCPRYDGKPSQLLSGMLITWPINSTVLSVIPGCSKVTCGAVFQAIRNPSNVILEELDSASSPSQSRCHLSPLESVKKTGIGDVRLKLAFI
jgi:hypothetical protein